MLRLYRYGVSPNSHDLLKCLGLCLMCIDHLGLFYYTDQIWFRVVGRLAAPIFFFLVGYSRSNRIYPSLLIYGGILTALTYILSGQVICNILLNIALIRLLFSQMDLQGMSDLRLAAMLACFLVCDQPLSLHIEYGMAGCIIALASRLCAYQDRRSSVLLALALGYYLLREASYFKFIDVFSIMWLFSLCMILLFCYLKQYRLKDFSVFPGTAVMLFCSRYSLQLYFWHLCVIKFIIIVSIIRLE